jgi:hypothetical protein
MIIEWSPFYKTVVTNEVTVEERERSILDSELPSAHVLGKSAAYEGRFAFCRGWEFSTNYGTTVVSKESSLQACNVTGRRGSTETRGEYRRATRAATETNHRDIHRGGGSYLAVRICAGVRKTRLLELPPRIHNPAPRHPHRTIARIERCGPLYQRGQRTGTMYGDRSPYFLWMAHQREPWW